jgi:4-hydroxythreonine-4-phosphate dehydrogenase
MPFVEKINQNSVKIMGPYPADSLYFRAVQGDFDIVISLYHDQGLIPIKLLGFYDAVNVSLGLPIIRTSPDHGTAFDIAYKKEANLNSFLAATNLAIDFWNNKNG